MLVSAPVVIASDPLIFEERKDKMYRYFGDLAPELQDVKSPQELYDMLRKARLRTLFKSALAEKGTPRYERLKRRGDVVIPAYMQEVTEQFEGVKA
jgi:hypothetical protein